MPPEPGAPVGRTSARADVTASGAGLLRDEQRFVRSAALGCIKVPSGAGKTEILAKWDSAYEQGHDYRHSRPRACQSNFAGCITTCPEWT